MSVSKDHLVKKYNQIISSRQKLWDDLEQIPEGQDWLTKRLSSHQWSIDEVLRHLLGSEIRYVQQPIEPTAEQYKGAVLAQWVGKIFFRFEENEHMELDELIEAFEETQKNTNKIINKWNENILNTQIEAPWREMIPYKDSVIHFLEHEMSHMGQVNFMLTYFRGPPEFESDWFNNETK